MTRQTSIDVYHQIESEGLLSQRRWQVYETLYHHGPLTAMETGRLIKSALDHSISPRFAELKRLGVIEEVGRRHCTITGRISLIWATTENLPRKRVKDDKIICSHCNGKGHISQGRLF